jgi:hypothetical protein
LRSYPNRGGSSPKARQSYSGERMSEPKRIQRKRTKGWRMPEGAVYVGRPTRWGNPVRVSGGIRLGNRPTVGACVATQAVEHYRHLVVDRASFHATDNGGGFWHVTANPVNDRGDQVPTEREIRETLAGRDLACWCPLDQPCHADVLLELANRPTPDAHPASRESEQAAAGAVL